MSSSEATSTPPLKKQKIEETTIDEKNIDCVATEKKFQSKLWTAGGLMELKEMDVVLRHQINKDVSPVKLGYFPIRALAFVPQLMLEESGISYENHILAGSSFGDRKTDLTFGRMPILFDWFAPGDHLVQSGAIIRALALKTGLAGANHWEHSRCDMLFEQLKEAFNRASYSIADLKKGGDLAKVPQWESMSRVNDHDGFQKSMAALKLFEGLLQKSKSKYLVGMELTYIDLALWSKLLELSQQDSVPDWAEKLKLPHLNELYSIIKGRPNINAFLESGRLLPRIGEGYKFKAGIFCKP